MKNKSFLSWLKKNDKKAIPAHVTLNRTEDLQKTFKGIWLPKFL